jgi:hypothetical protein
MSLLLVSEESWTFLATEFAGPPTPTPEFAAAVAALPAGYDWGAYGQFIEDWGDVYVTRAEAGGLILVSTYVHECILETVTVDEFEESANALFIFVSGKDGSSTLNNTLLANNSDTSVALLGGSAVPLGVTDPTAPLTPAARAAWLASLPENMVPVRLELSSLADLMGAWPAQQENFRRAVLQVCGAPPGLCFSICCVCTHALSRARTSRSATVSHTSPCGAVPNR